MEHPESIPQDLTLENTVDREGIEAITLAKRLAHPVIKTQVLDILESIECERDGKTEYAQVFDEATGKGAVDETGKPVVMSYQHVAKTRELLEEEYERKREQIATVTWIDFTDREPRVSNEGEIIPLNWEHLNGKLSSRAMNMVEAHEKGHFMRPYRGQSMNAQFASVFEPEAAEAESREFYPKVAAYAVAQGFEQEKIHSFEKWKENYYPYLFSAREVAERMSQLKNYFGTVGDERFTKEQLDYARTHYVEDIGLDNGMSIFFAAITPEKEAAFLTLINSAGI